MQHPQTKPAVRRRFTALVLLSAWYCTWFSACAAEGRFSAEVAPAPLGDAATRPVVQLPATPTIDWSEPILALAGTIVVRQADGTERRDADGTLKIMRSSPHGGGTAVVPIEAGQFYLQLFRNSEGHLVTAAGEEGLGFEGRVTQYSASGAIVDGEELYMNDPQVPYEPLRFGDHGVCLTAQQPLPVELIVRDEVTGTDVERVYVAELKGLVPISAPDFLGTSVSPDLRAREKTSPFLFKPWGAHILGRSRAYSVASPGYASLAVDLDLYSGGSRLVLLERATPHQHGPIEASTSP